MPRLKCLTLVMLGTLLLSMACLSCGPKIEDVAEVRDATLEYLRKHYPDNVPQTGLAWQEEDATPVAPVELFIITQFTSNGLTVKVSTPEVAPQNIIYTTTVTDLLSGWHWQGEVKQNGTVTELSSLTEMTEAWGQNIAEEFVRNSPTFSFDGFEETLMLTGTMLLRCPYCWAFTFKFDCRYPGYGNREGEVLAQVITHHEAVITVEMGEVISAVMDEQWDMQWQWKSPYQS